MLEDNAAVVKREDKRFAAGARINHSQTIFLFGSLRRGCGSNVSTSAIRRSTRAISANASSKVAISPVAGSWQLSFQGLSFRGCHFDYATFERTLIDIHVLERNAPAHENLKLRFARSLRINYQQIGDAAAVNKAIRMELEANQTHHWKAWRSAEAYYRDKYQGWSRAKMFYRWLQCRCLDFLWGNGENTLKLCRSVLLVLLVMALVDAWSAGGNIWDAREYFRSAWKAPQLLLGALSPTYYSSAYWRCWCSHASSPLLSSSPSL